MTDIGLILNPKPPNMTYFLLQRVFTLENGVRLNNYQSNKLNIDPQITPPEFTQTLNPPPTHHSKLSFRRYKILEEIAQKHKSVNSFELADAGNIPLVGKGGIQVSIKYGETDNKTMPVIAFGSSGISVKILQKLLICNGYGVPPDGLFGPMTESAVKAFQNRRRLPIDGVVGQKTWWELTI